MYRRYDPKPGIHPQKPGKPTGGELNCVRQTPPRQVGKAPQMPGKGQGHQTMQNPQNYPENHQQKKKTNPPREKHTLPREKQHPVLGLLPSSVYNPETKKILGFFSAEDLLLAALIFLLLESEDAEDSVLVYLLLYILISEYIDLPF